MQIRNLSGTEVPRALWRELANTMGFGGALPEKLRRKWPCYYDGRTLQVTVNRRTTRNVTEGEVTCGSYSLGKIWLYPCPKCTDGFLTHVFLYELCMAWLDAFHWELSFDRQAGALCDDFADRAYKLLGGKRRRRMKCWACQIPETVGPRRLRRFRAYVDMFRSADGAAIERMMKEASADRKWNIADARAIA